MPHPANRKLPILLVTGPSSTGKSYVTERVLALNFAVTTAKVDRVYSKALRHAGVSPTDEDGTYSIGKEALRLHNGDYPPETSERFFKRYEALARKHVQRAIRLGVGIVFEGYALIFPKEVQAIQRAASQVTGRPPRMVRIMLAPSLEDWNRYRAERPRRRPRAIPPAEEDTHERAMRPPEPVPGVADHQVATLEEVEPIAASMLKPHKWHQRFSLGPVTTRGPSDSHGKFNTILTDDIVGKRVIDLCCATGVVAIMIKNAGASEVAGIEINPLQYAKGLELQKVLARNSDLDPIVEMHLGDVWQLLPALGQFDTAVMLGAMHYFGEYQRLLGLIGRSVREAAYVEFNFREGDLASARAPDGVHAYRRASGNTIYLANRRTLEQLIAEAMPGFRIEERTPIPGPGRKIVFEREIWRLRRA